MQIGVQETAEKLLRDYGDQAEAECDAPISYYEMQGDKAVANGYRRVRALIPVLREKGGKA